jgi:hypothetical protein
MKLLPSPSRRCSGILLVECLVYLTVFVILLGGALTVFYFCWDHSAAITYATNDIGTALNAGERWRADVRAATGKIIVETDSTSQTVWIQEGKTKVVYRFSVGEIRRQDSAEKSFQLLLSRVKSSQMETEMRGGVTAWSWELELAQHRKETHLPLLFTFEAAQTRP